MPYFLFASFGTRQNVNLLTGEILITHTKRNKERMVVMSDDMAALARNYALKRAMFANGNPYFFPSNSGEALTREAVYSAFNRAWSLAESAGQAEETGSRIRPPASFRLRLSEPLDGWGRESHGYASLLT